jgi:flavin reductase (DIM6/NTAB) family NADH-FMN oxidoreductase RutF
VSPETPVAAFNDLVGAFDTPMIVATTVAGSERAGCLVGFHTQASIDPPRLLVCLSKVNHTTRVAARAHWMALHVLRDGDLDLARRFGGLTDDHDPVDKLAGCRWRPGPEGVPILVDLDCILGRILLRVPNLGDHVGHLVRVDDVISDPARRGRSPLGYQQVRDLDPGHPPDS